MQFERVILHSDLNSFYASVEIALDPSLKGKPVAVCGDEKDRHGIVLAKSEMAKAAGIKTGMANWEAKLLCPSLIIIYPKYGQYLKYSNSTREIYKRYTDRVEPFGMDENWVDLTGCVRTFDEGVDRANEIRETVKRELGLTVSIGVSFNKIFAKLGSDMKKPDAITVISRENYKQKVWPLQVNELLFVGRATYRKLVACGLVTIGDLANADPKFLQKLLGKNGRDLWVFANGVDGARVMPHDYRPPIKSIGRGITCVRDMEDCDDVWKIMLELSQDVGNRLHTESLMAQGVQIFVKRNDLSYEQYQCKLPFATQSSLRISRAGMELFNEHYDWKLPVRAVTIRAIDLMDSTKPIQLDFFQSEQVIKQTKLEDSIFSIRQKFGNGAVYPARLMGNKKLMPGHNIELAKMPAAMYQ